MAESLTDLATSRVWLAAIDRFTRVVTGTRDEPTIRQAAGELHIVLGVLPVPSHRALVAGSCTAVATRILGPVPSGGRFHAGVTDAPADASPAAELAETMGAVLAAVGNGDLAGAWTLLDLAGPSVSFSVLVNLLLLSTRTPW